jgi:hypothetical protein
MSVIDLATTAYVANSVTENLFNANAWNFFTDGWLGRSPSGATDNSYELSLYELVTGAIGLDAYSGSSTGTYGVSTSGRSSPGGTSAYAMQQIKNNLQQNGGKLFGTIIVAPVIAKVGKKLLAKPLINPVNRGLKKLGISNALGVKL